MRFITDEVRRERASVFLAGVQAVKRTVEPCREKDVLSARALGLLVKAALEPGTTLLEMYRALGLSGGEGKSAQESLIARGLVRVRRLVRKGRGAQPQVLEITKCGKEVLGARGITPTPHVLKGGFLHDCCGRGIARWCERRSYRYSFERTLGAKCFDVVYEDEGGLLHGVEVCLTGSATLNAEQLFKAGGVAGVVDVLGLCETAAFAKAIRVEFARIDQLGLYREKVRVGLLADFME
jgi:hypothetical protein